MRILNNPILGMNFARYGLVLNEKGLYKRVKTKNKCHELFLTNDVVKIVELIDIDFKTLSDEKEESAYVHLLGSKYILKDLFIKPRGKDRQITNFSKFIINSGINKFESEPIRTKRVESILGIELKSKILETRRILANYESNKFVGKKILPYLDNYDIRNFPNDIQKFKSGFETKLDFMKFMIDSTLEEVVERFKNN